MNKLIVFAALFSSHLLYGQYEKIDQISWGGRALNPIKIEVARLNDKLVFTATNSSYYPYQLELEFKTVVNLSPMLSRKSILVRSGISKILEFQIVHPGLPFDYSYTTKYQLGNPREEPNENFPYLFPLAKGSVIKYFEQITPDGKIRFGNVYAVQPGDTVFAMRKGIVTALPDHAVETDRLLKMTLEVLHSDGTVAIYENLNLETFVALGDKVFPGQPLGTIMSSSSVRFYVFRFFKDGRIASIEHQYATNNTDVISSRKVPEGMIVVHPEEIIKKEMNKREIKKMGQ